MMVVALHDCPDCGHGEAEVLYESPTVLRCLGCGTHFELED